MKTSTIKRLYPVIFVTIAVIMMAILPCFTGCNNLVLSEDPEELELLQKVFSDAGYYQYDEEAEIYTVYDAGKNRLGYAFIGKGEGNGGEITILIGLKDKETIEGIDILSHGEQYCVGEYGIPLDFSDFIVQFAGMKIDDCELEKYDGQVDGITGATISSTAVVGIVRETALEKIEYIN